MKIQGIMSTHVATVRPTDTLSTAAQVMLWAGGNHLPVVDGGRIVGILSATDLFRVRGAEPPRRPRVVGEAMVKQVQTVGPAESVAMAAGRMARENIGCLPVVDDGELVGIVTNRDILLALENEAFARENGGLSKTLAAELTNLRALREHLHLQSHLGAMELREHWSDLQAEIAQAERMATTAGDEAITFVRKARNRARAFYHEVVETARKQLAALEKNRGD